MKTITTEEFFKEYLPIQNPFTENGSYDNSAFETYGKEVQYLNKFSHNQIWTSIDGDDETTWIVPGFRLVNRNFYFVTNIPWENEEIQVNDNEMLSIEDACVHCYNFALSINIPLSVNKISDYFKRYKSNHTPGFVTVGEAKYRCIELIEEYFEDNFMEQDSLTDDQKDKIHDFFSNLI